MNNPPLTRHERRRQQTRRLLIQTTLELVLEKGYDAISIQEITDRADLGRGTFYIHFKDKEDVAWSAIQDLILEMEQQAHHQFADRRPEQVEYYALLNIFRHSQQNRDLYRVVFGSKGSSSLTGRVQDLLAKIFLADIRDRRGSEAARREVPDEFLAQMMTGLVTRLVIWWLETPNEYSAEQMAAMTYRAVYRQAPPGADGQPAKPTPSINT